MGGGGDKTNLQVSNHSTASAAAGDKDKKEKEAAPQASLTETLDFAFQCGPKIKIIFCLGFFAGICNGLVYPALAYLFSTSFTDLSSADATADLSVVRELAFTFMIVGVYALVAGLFQSWCFEILAYHATQNFRLQWFSALLRQDTAYFDVHDAGGIAGQVGPSSNKYRRGVGRKFGEGIQFLTTGIGGVACKYFIIRGGQSTSKYSIIRLTIACCPQLVSTRRGRSPLWCLGLYHSHPSRLSWS